MPEANSKRIIKMQNKSFQGRNPLCALVLFNNKKRQELVLCCRSSRAFCSLTVGTIRAAARKKGSAGTGQKETIRKKPANVLFLKEEKKNNTFGKINEGLRICQSVWIVIETLLPIYFSSVKENEAFKYNITNCGRLCFSLYPQFWNLCQWQIMIDI